MGAIPDLLVVKYPGRVPSVPGRQVRVGTDAKTRPIREDGGVKPTGRIRFGLALAVVVGVVAVSGAFWLGRDQQNLPVTDLLRIESRIDVGLSPGHAALAWTFEIVGGQRALTAAEFNEWAGEGLRQRTTVEDLQAQMDTAEEVIGVINLVRVTGVEGNDAGALGIGTDGFLVSNNIEVDETGRIATWQLTEYFAGPRLPAWQTGLILVGGWAFVGAAWLAGRSRRTTTAVWLIGGAVVAFAQVLVLSDTAALYLIGRVAPMLLVPIAVWILLDATPTAGRRWLVPAAVAVPIAGAIAMLLMDPARIGHPPVSMLLADDAEVFRTVSAGVALLAAVVMGAVAAVVLRRRPAWRPLGDPAPWVVLATAAIWAAVGAIGAVDLTVGDAALSGEALPAGWLVAVALVPVGSALTTVYGRWDRAELADLVVDLEGGGGDLQPAVARALGDDSLRLLRWSDDMGGLVDSGGRVIDEEVGEGRSRTHIRSAGQVVGALDHDVLLLRRPERLQAVAAAVGMALQVERLNAKVTAQLAEVRASRARIVSAGDVARKRVERDLHDGAQQRLVALGLLLQRGRRLADGRVCEEVSVLLDQASGEVREALTELRDVSRGMHPALLAERGLEAAVEGLAERLPIAIEAKVASTRFPPEVELASYYVVAEALTNVAKHADAAAAQVTVEQIDGNLRITVTDDGCGGATMNRGSGLEGLADRVAAVGGHLQIDSPIGKGTTVEAVVPCV